MNTPDAMREALEKIANSKQEWIKDGVGYVEPITRFAGRLKSIAQAALATPEASHSEEALREILAQEFERVHEEWLTPSGKFDMEEIRSGQCKNINALVALAAMRRIVSTAPTIAPSARTNETEE